jgi:hypothetical protein
MTVSEHIFDAKNFLSRKMIMNARLTGVGMDSADTA